MPIALPNLDDLTWAQLTEEGRSLIPAWAPEWTDHNPSDPGITLMELFAHLSEILIYRLNRIGPANLRAFLKLIEGPGEEFGDLNKARTDALARLRLPQRAITAEDFEALTFAVNKRLGSPAKETVARATCIFRQNLENRAPKSRLVDAPGHVSVLVMAKVNGRAAQASDELIRSVQDALEPARLVTTRVHVVRPRYLKVGVRLTLVTRINVSAEQMRAEAIKRLGRLFDPLEGGPDGEGWPFGRDAFVSEVYDVLAKLPGVDRVIRSIAQSTQEPRDELFVESSEAPRRVLNAQQKLEAIRLDPDELVELSIDEHDITVISQRDAAGKGENSSPD